MISTTPLTPPLLQEQQQGSRKEQTTSQEHEDHVGLGLPAAAREMVRHLLLAPRLRVDPAQPLLLVVAATVEQLVVDKIECVPNVLLVDGAVDTLSPDGENLNNTN